MFYLLRLLLILLNNVVEQIMNKNNLVYFGLGGGGGKGPQLVWSSGRTYYWVIYTVWMCQTALGPPAVRITF